MKAAISSAALSLSLFAAPSFAQIQPPAQTPPPAVQKPTPPAQPTPQPPAATPQPPRPFPEGAKMAYLNIQRVASESVEGKASTAKLDALRQKKSTELSEKQKALQANQQKLSQGGGVMNDSARAQLEKEIERQQKETERFTQDAQTEVQELQQELQGQFQQKLMPVIQQVAAEKGLQILFSMADAGIIWADTALDLTADVIKKFDVANPGTAASKPSVPPKKPPVQ
jgi:outer membrane protein